MAKVKGTNKRTRPKRSYKKPGSKKGRGDLKDLTKSLVVKKVEE